MMDTISISTGVCRVMIAALFALSLHAQPSASEKHDASNGRGWAGMPVLMRPAYISGVLDGIGAAGVAKDSLLYDIWTSKLRVGEYEEALDRFYAEPTDRMILIPWAMSWIARKSNGSSEADLTKYEATLRAMAASLDNRRAKAAK